MLHHSAPPLLFCPQPQSVDSGKSPSQSDTADLLRPSKIRDNIHCVNWQYFKQKFNFNCTLRQALTYISQIYSRKGVEHNQPEFSKVELQRKAQSEFPTLLSQHVFTVQYLLAIHAFTLNTPGFFEISGADLVKLFDIFFYKVNSIFPIINEHEFWELHRHDRVPNVTIYAMVLVVARDELAEPILDRSFIKGEFNENLKTLITELEMKIRQLLLFLPELGDHDKLLRFVVHLLLTLSLRFNKTGNEQSSLDLSVCVSLAYALLIHQLFFLDLVAKRGNLGEQRARYLRNLFWVLVIFDRFNAMTHSKGMFVKRRDYNVARPDSPHLNRLVTLVYELEDTMVAAFRPPRSSLAVVPPMETQEGDPEFQPARLVHEEMQYLKNPASMLEVFTKYRLQSSNNPSHLPRVPAAEYCDRMVFFLERYIRGMIVLILRNGQIKYDTVHVDEMLLVLSDAFYRLFEMLKDGCGHQLVMSMPLIPSQMLVAFSIPLSMRLQAIKLLKCIGDDTIDYNKLAHASDLSRSILSELEKYAPKWWFVNEVLLLIAGFRHSIGELPRTSHERVLIPLLVDDKETLPPLTSISSPGYYDLVIKKEEIEEEQAKSGGEVHTKVLMPPLLRDLLLETDVTIPLTTERLALRAKDLRDMIGSSDNIAPESLSSAEDLNFDLGRFAEMINTELNFMPSMSEVFQDSLLDI